MLRLPPGPKLGKNLLGRGLEIPEEGGTQPALLVQIGVVVRIATHLLASPQELDLVAREGLRGNQDGETVLRIGDVLYHVVNYCVSPGDEWFLPESDSLIVKNP